MKLGQPGLAVVVLGIAWLFTSLASAGDEPESLFLTNGLRLEGTSEILSDGHLTWRMPHGTELFVPLEEIDRIEYGSLEQAAIAGQERPPVSPETGSPGANRPEADPLNFADERNASWFCLHDAFDSASEYVIDRTKRIAVGGRFMKGNTDQDVLDLSAKLESTDGHVSKQLTLAGEYGRSNGETVANEWSANFTFDFAKERKRILFVTSLNEYDEFENLDYRGTLSGGFGYRWYNTKTHRLIARIGPAVTHEVFKDPRHSRVTSDILSEVESVWPVFEHTKFEHKSTFRPSVDDLSVFRLLSNSGLLFPLDEREQWMIKLGFKFEYNSQPNEGRLKADYTTSVSLVYTPK